MFGNLPEGGFYKSFWTQPNMQVTFSDTFPNIYYRWKVDEHG
jgi:hypothetical protein